MDALSDIARTIELAVAPVFLLAGIGALLNVVTSRLGRAVDRARILETQILNDPEIAEAPRIRGELQVLDRRMLLAQRAIVLSSFSALLVCIVVATLFIGELAGVSATSLVAVLFVAAMAALIGGLSFFLAEVSIATRMLRVRAELFMKK
ncbi:MAG: DUF2721 domain-containing protein [Pseudomonadota bacterium]